MVTVRDLGLDKKARFCRLHSVFLSYESQLVDLSKKAVELP